MNPPYGRVRLGPEDRERFASILYGHANLYGLFLGAALDTLDPVDGVLAALVPTSFTSGLYFQNLRAELSRSAPLREASFVADRVGVFAGVLQETCMAVFTRRRTRRTDITAVSGAVRSSVARVPTPRGSGPWLLPRHSADAPAAAAASVMPLTLRSAGWSASTGPLVWNRRRADLAHDLGPDRVRIVWAADLDGGVLHQDPARDDHRYLRLSKPSDMKVMVLAEPCVLVQRTTAPEQRRRLVGVELDEAGLAAVGGRIVVENHVNVLRPRADGPHLIGHRLVAHLLASTTLDRIMRCMSGSVAVSAFELESLPLPAPETLLEWDNMAGRDPDALIDAVSRAYRPGPA
jgi:adenine-specific DNA-methyltransferase